MLTTRCETKALSRADPREESRVNVRYCSLLVAALALSLAAPLRAKTIAYPKEKSLLSIVVPAGWQVHYDGEGPLTIQTPDAAVVAVFDSVKGVEDDATAKQAVGAQKKATAETTGFTDFREINPVQKMQLSPGIEAMCGRYHAKFPSGEPCIYIVAIFSPNDSNYFSAELSVKARALTDKLDEQRQALLGSIKAVSDDTDQESDDEDK